MDTGTDVYVEAASKLRNDIESTKAALGEKIQALQHEVRGAFAEASDRMKGTLRHARDAVHPAVQFHRHPFAFCAVAFGVGFLLRQRVVSSGGARRVGRQDGAWACFEHLAAHCSTEPFAGNNRGSGARRTRTALGGPFVAQVA